jgi:hypothetical protein
MNLSPVSKRIDKMKCDYHGNLENGEKLVVGKIYKAIDEDGKQGFFRANISGTLFAMWRVTEDGDRCGGYCLPHYMDFLIDNE